MLCLSPFFRSLWQPLPCSPLDTLLGLSPAPCMTGLTSTGSFSRALVSVDSQLCLTHVKFWWEVEVDWGSRGILPVSLGLGQQTCLAAIISPPGLYASSRTDHCISCLCWVLYHLAGSKTNSSLCSSSQRLVVTFASIWVALLSPVWFSVLSLSNHSPVLTYPCFKY